MPASTMENDDPIDPTSQEPVETQVGNLTADPKLQRSARGTPYCRMRLAVSVPVTHGDWGSGRSTRYFDVTAFGTLAEHCAQSLHRGDRVVVAGRTETRTWTGNDGTERTETVILAEALGPDLRWATATLERVARVKVASTADRQP